MLMVVATAAHKFGHLGTYPFLWCLVIAAALAGFSAILAVGGLVSLWQVGAEGGRRSAWSLLLSGAILTPFAYALFLGMTLPQLTQVSTDLSDPPAMNETARPANGFVNAITPIGEADARAQMKYYPEIAGRRYPLSPDQLGDIVKQLLKSRGWRIGSTTGTGSQQDPIVITALANTLIFSIPADVSLRIVDDGETSVVDMRSAIRFGSHDLGLDRDFVVGFLDDLDAAVALP
jgi:uncharacterized protein (DUF1499 family)